MCFRSWLVPSVTPGFCVHADNRQRQCFCRHACMCVCVCLCVCVSVWVCVGGRQGRSLIPISTPTPQTRAGRAHRKSLWVIHSSWGRDCYDTFFVQIKLRHLMHLNCHRFHWSHFAPALIMHHNYHGTNWPSALQMADGFLYPIRFSLYNNQEMIPVLVMTIDLVLHLLTNSWYKQQPS